MALCQHNFTAKLLDVNTALRKAVYMVSCKTSLVAKICDEAHNIRMNWKVVFHEEFRAEFLELPESAQNKLIANARLLEQYGATLSRPYVDTLKGSSYSNMKELRFNTERGVWRVAFAFDPKRQAVLLIAGDKSGVNQKRFYRDLINLADKRFKSYLNNL